MLGLLLMAGVGFAATALMEHIDVSSNDEPHPEDEDHAPAEHDGSLLDDPDTSHHADHTAQQDHASAVRGDQGYHSAPDNHHADQQAAHHSVEDQLSETPDAEAGPSSHGDAAPQQSDVHHAAPSTEHGTADPAATQHHAAAAPPKFFGTEGNDTLHGSARGDLMEGNGGDDKLFGHAGNDNLVSFDAGHDTVHGGTGNDSLHGYLVQKQPGDLSYVVEDHQADTLLGGLGKDSLFLGSDDVGSGGKGADSFHVSWDVEHGHPAEITDYNARQDKIYVEFTSNHADDGMTDIKPEEQTITTELMKDGSGTSILINGQAIAHVLGATHLNASDIGLIHA